MRAFARNLESSGDASSTASHVFSVLKLIVVTALQDGLISKDVTSGISVQRKGSKERIIATPAQDKAIEAAIDPHYKLLVATGMPHGELAGGGACQGPSQSGTSETSRAGGLLAVVPGGVTASPC